MRKVKVKYISDIPSIFFKKGMVYTGFLPEQVPDAKMIAFYFCEEEMDEAGYYALPVSRFVIIGK